MYKTTLKIDGMMCGMCESHINDKIRASFKVKKVSSSHSKGETVMFSEEKPDEAKLKSVIEETGYELKGITTAETEDKGGILAFFKKK